MRLCPGSNLRAIYQEFSFAYLGFKSCHTIEQIFLSPCPTAAQWLGISKPNQWLNTLEMRIGSKLKHRAVVEYKIHFFTHAPNRGSIASYFCLQDATRDIILVPGYRRGRSMQAFVFQSIRARQPQLKGP